jgi:hypothetical protein
MTAVAARLMTCFTLNAYYRIGAKAELSRLADLNPALVGGNVAGY